MAVAFSPDGKTLASARCDNRARVWDLADGRERFHLDGSATSRRARSVAFSPDGARLAVSFLADPTVKIVDATTGVELAAFCGHDAGVCAVQFSPDGLTLATGSIDRTVKLWDVRRLVPTPPGR
jgi:WD40 repeat protein